MKKIVFALSLGLSVMHLSGQEVPQPKEKKEVETLFKDAKPTGVFLSFDMKAVELNKQAGLMSGGQFAIVFGHKFNIGGVGYGLITDIKSDALKTDGNPYYLTMGYGGLIFEPVIASHKMVHFTTPIILGAGGVSLNEYELTSNQNSWNYNTYGKDYDFFLLAEPGVNLEVNIFKVLRFDAGVSYRFPSDVKMLSTNNSDIRGLNTNFALKLGFF